MLLIANNGIGGYFNLIPDSGATPPTIPVFSIPLRIFSLIAAAVQAGTGLQIQLLSYTLSTGAFRSLSDPLRQPVAHGLRIQAP